MLNFQLPSMENGPSNKMKSVYVAIPNYCSHLYHSVVFSLIRLVGEETKKGRKLAVEIVPRKRAPRVRNYIAHNALKFEMDYLLTIDDDHVFAPDSLSRLIAYDVDIIGALSFIRSADMGGGLTPSIYKKVQDDPPRYQSIKQWERNSLIEVDGMGMAFVLIRRRVLEEVSPPWWWIPEEKGLGEDLYFCNKVRNAGFKIYCDTSVEAPHLTEPVLAHSSLYFQEREDAR